MTISGIGVRARTWRQQEWTLAAPQVYLACVIATGLYVLATSMWSMAAAPPDLRCAALCLLTVAGAQLMLRMPEVPVSFSISDIFTFTTALMFGPGAGAVVVAVEAAVLSMRLVQSNRSLTRYLFNVSATAIAMFLSARLFFALSQTAPLASDPSAIIEHVGALATFAAVYFALNTALVAIAVALAGRSSPWQVWHGHFMSLWPGYVGGASAAGMGLFLVSTQHGDLRVLAFVVPIPFIVYVTFRTAVARMQDDVAHLTRINSMYLATIETLAQAVDARDQVTHDHLRRVQTNAMLLARELKIEDTLQLRALEAAALLHDMGKLAVPEHILNKPDKLTAAEFEVMKLHSTIGADILSPIEFPFPLVPIVRHHHENWDGTGYPDGLRGDQIPIGARVLAVVDCFDALTSDRPYRRAFSPDRALGLILERSGVMYDPLVVAALLRIKDDISVEPAAASAVQSAAVVERFAHTRQAVRTDEAGAGISALTVHMAGRLGQAVGRHRDIGALCDELGDQLARQVPGLTIVIYQYDPQLNALFARAAAGVHRAAVEGVTIGLGLRLTGWVGAHRTTIVNSEAALDLGNVAAQLRPVPQLCLSTPLIAEDRLAGVLTVYSTLDRPFASTDVALFEMLAALLAPLVHSDALDRWEGSAGESRSASLPPGPTETDSVPATLRIRSRART